MIEIEIDDAGVREALERLARAGRDARPALAEVGEYLIDSTRRRFQAGVAPDGQRWAPNSEVTVLRLLARYRDMYRKDGSLSAKGRRTAAAKRPLIGESRSLSTQWSYEASADQVVMGTPVRYAATHQFGARRGQFGRTRRGTPIPWGDIPARPFLGLSAEDGETVVGILRDFLRREAGGV